MGPSRPNPQPQSRPLVMSLRNRRPLPSGGLEVVVMQAVGVVGVVGVVGMV